MNLTTEGTPEAERRARHTIEFITVAMDFVLWSACNDWRWRHVTNNPFR